jgi:hypothetical protein
MLRAKATALLLPASLAAVALASALLPLQAMAADAEATSIEEQVRILDRRIILDLIKFAKFNVGYQQTMTHRPQWRRLFYPLAQEAAYAGLFGYSVTDLSQRIENWNRPGKISRTAIKHGLDSAAVGTILGGSSSGVELLANYSDAMVARRKGFSPTQSTRTVHEMVSKIDGMLSDRDRMMAQVPSPRSSYQLLQLKGQLCKYERDRLVFEFKQWNVHSKSYSSYKKAFYVLNIIANSTRFAGVQLALNSFSNRLVLGAVGPTLVSSSIIASLAPALSTAWGNHVRTKQRHYLSTALQSEPFLSDAQAKEEFDQLSALLLAQPQDDEHDKVLRVELALLRKERIGMDALINRSERDIEKLRRVAAQQSITAPLVGMITAGSGTLGIVNYNAYRLQPKVSNHIGVVGDTATLTAEVIALYATPKSVISAYLYERKLTKQSEHPDQLLARRLHELNALETIIQDPDW